MRTVLAVDGGNSKTDVALIAEDGSVLGTGRGGPFQPQLTSVDTAVDAIAEAVRAMLGQDAKPPFADHVAAYVAGADLPVEEEVLRDEILARGYGQDVVVGNDTFALLRAGASGPAGVVIACGGGINAAAVSPTGEVARYPSLGKLTGDWGGGYGLGKETLWSAIRSEDGRGRPTALQQAVREHFGTHTVEEASLNLYYGRTPLDRLHELVPVLMSVAASGDEVARSIVTRMADEATALGMALLRRLGLLDTPMEVVLGGGVLTARDPLLNGLIEERYAEQAPQAKLVVADVPPIMGAALLGLDTLGATEEAKATLRAHFHAMA
ncbi:BadF/BadG/BcrA/BcrD ATPase family protein [Streptosporangium sp. NPDC051023]|uniref:N-acetylglucosamine kinase n=1 Tax=Streptosporangium sp. NPDC051023 TaxID=3155410 RepID=UPI00344BDB64